MAILGVKVRYRLQGLDCFDDRLRSHLKARGAIAIISNMIRRKRRFRWTGALRRERNQSSASSTSSNSSAASPLGSMFLAFLKLAAVRSSCAQLSPRPNERTLCQSHLPAPENERQRTVADVEPA